MENSAHTSILVFWDRRSGFGGRMGWVRDRWSVRVGRLSNCDFGKALAGRTALAGHSDADEREFL